MAKTKTHSWYEKNCAGNNWKKDRTVYRTNYQPKEREPIIPQFIKEYCVDGGDIYTLFEDTVQTDSGSVSSTYSAFKPISDELYEWMANDSPLMYTMGKFEYCMGEHKTTSTGSAAPQLGSNKYDHEDDGKYWKLVYTIRFDEQENSSVKDDTGSYRWIAVWKERDKHW